MTFLGRRAVSLILYCPCSSSILSKNIKNAFGNLSVKEQQPFCIIRNLSKGETLTSPRKVFNSPRKDFNSPRKVVNSSKSVNKHGLSVEKHLTNIGANVEKIQKEIKLPSTDLQEKVESSAEILGELCGLDVTAVGHMVSKRPRILLLNERQIVHCVETLRNVGLEDQNIATMLKKSPGILTSRIEYSLEEKLEVLYNLKVHPPYSVKDVLKIVTKCPSLVSTCTPASVEDKANFLLNDIGFYRHQLHKIIIKQPSILTFSKENIKSKFDYCYREMGVSMPEIAQCPRLWQCSLRRLEERHKYLRHLNIVTNRVDGYQLERIVTLSDHHFAETIALTSLTEFQAFLMEQ